MSDLFEDNGPGPAGNAHEYTVSEISGAVKRVIEGEFGSVRVRGEISRVSMPRSGHLYYDLKDDRSVIACVTWKGQAARLGVRPEEGMEVVASGRMTTFPGQSKYQLIVDDIRPAGVGALMATLEKRRKAFEAEGLFAPERKRPLPYLPEVIGVVTSPSGAVIRDILHRLRDRFPRRVLIWPVAVQGERCAPEVARAIAGFNGLPPDGPIPRPDVLIVARGGGSIEDLWGFNEEIVVRAAAASEIPLISAVGHETDTTLIDFVSDRRAPTPTAAAEMAVPVRLELVSWLGDQEGRLRRALTRAVSLRRQRLADLSRALPRPERLTETARQRLDRADERLKAALLRSVQARRLRLSESAGSLRPALLRRLIGESRRRLEDIGARLPVALARRIETRSEALRQVSARLRPMALQRETGRRRQDLQRLVARLVAVATGATRQRRNSLDSLERVRISVGYTETLKRGYAVVRGDGAVVTSTAEARAARELELQFADGRLPLSGRRRGKAGEEPPEQGSLF